jgi:hypothetical protein
MVLAVIAVQRVPGSRLHNDFIGAEDWNPTLVPGVRIVRATRLVECAADAITRRVRS